MQTTFDYVIAGAGAVGLAAALEIKKRKPQARVAVFEKEAAPGMHASGRNSGVLHSGIYYPPQSLKSKVCSRGAMLMKAFAKKHGISLVEKGKLITATCEKDLPALERLVANAEANNIRCEKLDAAAARVIEPYAGVYKAALFVADTAVIDSKETMRRLAVSAVEAGIDLRLGEPLLEISPARNELRTPSEVYTFGYFINCAGAYADTIASFFGLGRDYALVPFKGIYYQLSPEKEDWIAANIYPVPDPDMPFLGIHFTKAVSGAVYAGPTAIPVLGRENYRDLDGVKFEEVLPILGRLAKMYFSGDDAFRRLAHYEMGNYIKAFFYERAKKLVPELKEEDLLPCDKSGIRPQLVNLRTGKLEMDYILEQTPHSIHVLNSISPAFTSAFAFAEVLAARIPGLAE